VHSITVNSTKHLVDLTPPRTSSSTTVTFAGTYLRLEFSRLSPRSAWKDDKGNVYEWDSQHGELEKYNKRGKHQGSVDPSTGNRSLEKAR